MSEPLPPPATDGASPPVIDGASPMMEQYLAIKAEHPDALLFYRMGDFYEMFFDDAVKAAGALDIALTKRGRHQGDHIPMCGVPVKSHEGYLAQLIRKGFRVAVCEQTEDPAEARKRGSKSVVRRAVVRTVTAGTLTEDTLLDARSHNYLAGLAGAGGGLGLAWLDVSTGAFQVQPLAVDGVVAALARIEPAELLLPEPFLQRPELFDALGEWKDRLLPQPVSRFDSENGRRRLEALYGVGTLEAYGEFSRAELAAAGAVVDYVALTQKGQLPRIGRLGRLGDRAVMAVDAATRRNLELVRALSGERRGSLLSVLDRTVTGAGARLLAARLSAPLTDPAAIDRRLDEVRFFVDSEPVRTDVVGLLRQCPDLERALSRLTVGRGGPRDLAAVRDGLDLTSRVREALHRAGLAGLPAGIAAAMQDLGHHGELVDRLRRALGPELPLQARDGDFIASGYTMELDTLRELRNESRRLTAALQTRYAEDTGVTTLKVRFNNVLGYFVEVPAKQASKVPTGEDGAFIHRQTMANAVRFTTVELGELEGRIARAADQALALEQKLFEDLVAEVVGRREAVAAAAAAFAAVDVAAALAALAVERRWCRPEIDAGLDLEVVGGRHPVVEAALERGGGGAFVANDCVMGAQSRLWLLTGPNMAGKSTFLRQNALIAVLAQMGSYVPAERVRLGVVDRLFSRVGAADDLARGRSTFMVEMVETATILNQAGPRALVVLDEIGRGTATHDGLSIAWAVVEHLCRVNRCRGLFATHYHELTRLSDGLEGLSCHTMRVKEWQGDVVFLHEVAPGAADRSYGIHVARLAGLPPAVLERAEEVLAEVERVGVSSATAKLADELPLFAAAVRRAPSAPPPPGPPLRAAAGTTALAAAVAEVRPDDLTPREALEVLYRLKGLVDGEGH